VAKSKRIQNDPRFEIAFYENILKYSPRFIEALVALAELYTKEGLHDKGLELDRRLVALRPEDPVIRYNLACSLSLKGDVPAAFEAMKCAFGSGYEDFAHLEKDRDLLNLLSDPGFKDYYRGLRNAGKAV
jgi:tetratricopeptide (TPR) repeat protein